MDGSTRSGGRVFDFLRRHPVLLLLLLTPGIPEYLSSSSPVSAIVLNPLQFLLQLPLNLGLYGPGALLVREAMVRWRRGWATGLALGCAYGVFEEGTALSTMFNPFHSGGNLGAYGLAYGVSWVWAVDIDIFHSVVSIAVPIILLGLALPETKGRPFLAGRKLATAFGVLVADAVVLIYIVAASGFLAGAPRTVGSLIVVAALVGLGRALPAGALSPSSPAPRRRPRTLGLLGLCVFPTTFFAGPLGKALAAPPLAMVALGLAIEGLLLLGVMRSVGSSENRKQKIALCAGIVIPLMPFGVIAQFPLPMVLLLDVAFVLFLLRVWRGAPAAAVAPVDATPRPAEGPVPTP